MLFSFSFPFVWNLISTRIEVRWIFDSMHSESSQINEQKEKTLFFLPWERNFKIKYILAKMRIRNHIFQCCINQHLLVVLIWYVLLLNFNLSFRSISQGGKTHSMCMQHFNSLWPQLCSIGWFWSKFSEIFQYHKIAHSHILCRWRFRVEQFLEYHWIYRYRF